MALVSVVLPAYNEKGNIRRAVTALSGVLAECGEEYELVFVSDGSTDGTYEEIVSASREFPCVKGIAFSRNFGKEAAIFAGLEVSRGDAVIVMDCDLQHPPEAIPEMLRLWRDGAEIVEGMKRSRGKETLAYRLSAGLFYRTMTSLTRIDMTASSDFKLLDRRVVSVLLGLPERNTFFRALTFWAGFRTEKVYYEVRERASGESKWSTRSLIRYAVRNATSFSTLPLQLVTVLGWILVVFGLVLGIQTLVRFFLGNSADGFTTVILLVLIIGGFLMLSLGIIGHYLARVYEEVKGRPRYIIRDATENVPEGVKGSWR